MISKNPVFFEFRKKAFLMTLELGKPGLWDSRSFSREAS